MAEEDETLFQNAQRRVTTRYVESIPPAPEYWFDVSRLAETTERGGVEYYDWPVHMAEKTWVDLDAFIEAFQTGICMRAGIVLRRMQPCWLAAW